MSRPFYHAETHACTCYGCEFSALLTDELLSLAPVQDEITEDEGEGWFDMFCNVPAPMSPVQALAIATGIDK